MSHVLPAGAIFPYDFGFIPATVGQDGDALDVMLLIDEPAFTGCLIPARLIGVIEAEQAERDGKTERNNRLIAAACESHTHRDIRQIQDLGSALLDEIEYFFVSYNQARGKQFKPTGRFGPDRAEALVRQGAQIASEQP